ncbi:MAG: alpha/beta hydrolase fold domain-containing protein [Pseudomonadota bacterium]
MTLDWVNGDPGELRRAYAAERAVLDATAPADVQVSPMDDGPLSGLRFVPAGGGQGAPILYFHGGGWLLGSPETHRALCAWLSKLSGRRVTSVRYPLAPEHPYPAQRNAARAALMACLAEEDGPLFVAGDSAGGAMALWAAGDDTAHVAGVAAFYPAYGLTQSASISRHGPGDAALNAAALAAMYARLGADPAELQRDVAKTGAPVLVIAATEDPLFDDAIALAQDLHGRDVTLWHAQGHEHAFLHHGASDSAVRDWLSRVGAWCDATETAR